MKAKEYAQVIIDGNYEPDVIFQFSKDLMGEIPTIVKTRNCQSASAINSVFLEIDQKYRAVRRIVNRNGNIMREEGFKDLMHKLYADSPLRFELDFLKSKPKPEYIMGIDVASGLDFSVATPNKEASNGQQIPSTW